MSFEEYVRGKLTYHNFCELFKIAEESFPDEYCSGLIQDVIGEGEFLDMDFDSFQE